MLFQRMTSLRCVGKYCLDKDMTVMWTRRTWRNLRKWYACGLMLCEFASDECEQKTRVQRLVGVKSDSQTRPHDHEKKKRNLATFFPFPHPLEWHPLLLPPLLHVSLRTQALCLPMFFKRCCKICLRKPWMGLKNGRGTMLQVFYIQINLIYIIEMRTRTLSMSQKIAVHLLYQNRRWTMPATGDTLTVYATPDSQKLTASYSMVSCSRQLIPMTRNRRRPSSSSFFPSFIFVLTCRTCFFSSSRLSGSWAILWSVIPGFRERMVGIADQRGLRNTISREVSQRKFNDIP